MDFDTFLAQMPPMGFLPFAPRPVAIAARIHTAQPAPEARCVGCGCTDSRACPQGCSWLACDPPTQAQQLIDASSTPGWVVRALRSALDRDPAQAAAEAAVLARVLVARREASGSTLQGAQAARTEMPAPA